MAKYEKGVSGSVQAKNGMLHFVASYKDPITQKRKVKWKALGLPEGTQKAIVDKAKRDAQAKFEAEYQRYLDGYDDPKKYPLIDFLNEWLDKAHIHKIQESTYTGYKGLIRKMEQYFGKKITLADCKPRLIHSFYDHLRAEGDREQTILHYHNLLHAAFEYAIKQEIFDVNPMKRVERPQPKRFVGASYSVEEVQTLLALTEDDPLYIPIVFAVYCGMRRSEALGVSWSNVNFEKNIIHVCQKVVEVSRDGKTERIISEEMKTESSRRSFYMVPELKEILLKHKEKQERYRTQVGRSDSKKYLDMVCVNPLGDLIKPSYVTSHFPAILEKYGLRDIRFHDLRHTCASLLLSMDVNMKVIQKYLGHSNMSTTADIYSHLDVKATGEAGMKLGKLLSED